MRWTFVVVMLGFFALVAFSLWLVFELKRAERARLSMHDELEDLRAQSRRFGEKQKETDT